jgi:transcriptional regulator with XRE-family HTH domain
MPNERLRSSITAAGQSLESVAAHIGVDAKTVERWISKGRTPHRAHRWKAAQLLGHDEAYLWPEVLDQPRTQAASEAEFVHLYPHRGAVPNDLWRSLVADARDSLDFLAYSALFLPDSDPDLAKTLVTKASEGVRVRVLLGDPNGGAVLRRGQEEGINGGMAERVRIALSYLAPAMDAPGVEFRLHDTTLYNSIFRSDGTMLVNTHAYGSGAGGNPVLHLQRVAGGRVFDTYQQSFERVWEEASPAAVPVMQGRRKG